MRPLRTLVAAPAAALALLAIQGCGRDDRPATPEAPRAAPNAPNAPNASRAAAAAGDPVIVAAGDISCGTNTPAGTPCQQAATANVIGTVAPDAVLLLGDNQYEDGTLADYNAFYAPTWGRFKTITYPAPGNHEYQTANGQGYYDYLNGVGAQTGRAGDRSKGYYSYDLGAWHLIALNSNCGSVGGCGAGSPQEQWLRADLAAHPAACVLAYWHHPRFSSGPHGNDATYTAFWNALIAFDADVVLVGHDHDYERFGPQNASGVADNAHGLREWVVGTGGKEHYAFATIRANSQLRNNTAFGVLKLTLHPTGYDWQFVPVPGATLSDVGSATCNGASSTNQPPTASITAPANGASVTQGTSVSFSGTGTDPEDGTLSGASLVWTSSIDGQIGTGTSFSTSTLSAGQHTITLTAKDSKGATGTASRTITITSTGGSAVTARYTWSCGTVSHNPLQCAFDGRTSTSTGSSVASYTWSWGDGTANTTTTYPTTSTTHKFPAAGTYAVTLTVTDKLARTGSTSQAVTAGTTSTNQPPTASISAPASGATFTQGTSVSFSGSGSDPEDGALSGASLVWTSSIDGQIGTGTSFSTSTLSTGQHTITLTATDSQGATGTATRAITVSSSGGGSPVVASFTWSCGTVSHNPLQCAFDARTSTTTGSSFASYVWSWGDATANTTITYPTTTTTHKFAVAGTYVVTLTATDKLGRSGSASVQVTAP